MKRLVIDRRVVRNNLKAIKERAGGAAIIADLSANAYGMGILEIAALLRDDGVRSFAVSDPKDARLLRDGGFTEERLMMLRSTSDPEELSELLDLKVVCTVGSYDAAVVASGVAEAHKTVAEVQIKVDTGLGRYGFLPSEIDKMAAIFRYMPNLAVVGMFTTFAAPWRSKKLTYRQFKMFSDVLDRLTEMGFEPGIVHVCDSAALFRYEFEGMDAVRADTALSGRLPGRGGAPGLAKVGYIEAGVEEVHWLPKGHRVGYGCGTVTKRPTKVAVLSVGYYHGFGLERQDAQKGLLDVLRRRGKQVYARVNGCRARVLGEIGLMHTILDVTDIECSVGDLAVIDVDPVNVKGMPIAYI